MSPAAGLAAILVALGYAVVNAFGTWMVVRRHSGVAAGFFLAAAILTVGGVAVAFALPGAVSWVAVGALFASLSSWLNARLVMRRVIAWRHGLRVLVGMLAVLLAYLATRGA